MSGLVFLVVALGVCVVGFLYLWLRHRDRSTFMSSVKRFDKELSVLRPVNQKPEGKKKTRL